MMNAPIYYFMVRKLKQRIIRKVKKTEEVKTKIEVKETNTKELIPQEILEAGFEDGTVSSKSLRISREFREEFIAKYGSALCSILEYDRKIKHTDLSRIERGGGYAQSMNSNREKFAKDALPIFSKTAFIARDRKDYLSTFPMNIGRIAIGLYAPDNCKIYDPFAGHNSRMELCYTLGHSYTGVDICENFMKGNRKVKDYLYNKAKRELIQVDRKIELLEQSSTDVPQIKSESHDFTITSPPYWDIENYGPEPEQLGIGKTYQEFLDGLQLCANENFRILKPGSFSCWFINDFRKNGKFYPYHIDTYNILQKAGFDIFNIYIVDLKGSPNKAFLRWVVKTRILPKTHEFIVVAQKPNKE